VAIRPWTSEKALLRTTLTRPGELLILLLLRELLTLLVLLLRVVLTKHTELLTLLLLRLQLRVLHPVGVRRGLVLLRW
jgi:hypothetical protein